MTPERTSQLRRTYRSELDRAEETLVAALSETYKEITGRRPSDRLLDALDEAIRYEGL